MIRPKRTKAEKKALYRKDYPEPIKTRREELRSIMLEPESEREYRSRRKIVEYIEEDSRRENLNVYVAALTMMKAMPDKLRESGLSLWYLEEFATWLKKCGREEELREQFLSPEIQMTALADCHPTHKALVSQAFNITEKRLLEDVKEYLNAALQKHDYSGAADLALRHNLVSDYSFEELVLPLLLCEDFVRAYRVMQGFPSLQRECVVFLDKFTDIPLHQVEFNLEKYRKSPDMKLSLDSLRECKILRKMVTTNVVEYDYDPNLWEYAPNFNDFGCYKNLKYHIGNRYGGDVADEVYFQHMQDYLYKATPTVREKVLHHLWSESQSFQEEKKIDAISFAIMLGIESSTSSEIPKLMRVFFQNPDHKLQAAKELLEKRKTMTVIEPGEVLYVQAEERRWPITVVTSADDFSRLCNSLETLELEEAPYVGFDSEWRTGSATEAVGTKIALMQLFFSENVWIVDCVALESQEIHDELWQEFARRLLASRKIKVVGFDLGNDLRTFVTITALKETVKPESVENAFCLKRLTENVCEISMQILDLEKKTFKLADLTKKLLGIELDKAEQCSNWASRPLRKNQIIYAAMDAVVVVEAFKKVIKMTEEYDEMIDTAKLIAESNVRAPKKEKNKALSRKLNTIPWVEIYETLRDHRDPSKPLIRSYDMEVIVDTMLNGFGSSLRRVGIDVMIPDDVKDFRQKLKIMKQLGGSYQRHILTVPSRSYEALKADYESHTTAFEDLTSKAPLEQLISFFDRFNVEIKLEDEFVRCVNCNSRLLVKFPSPVIHFLHQYCVVYTQNVYNTRRQFPLEEWWKKMHRVNPADYGGLKVEWSRPTAKSDWYVATVPTGCLHVTRNTVIHNNMPYGVEVRINRVPDTEFHRPNMFFYVCGDCGSVNYDGRDPNTRDPDHINYPY